MIGRRRVLGQSISHVVLVALIVMSLYPFVFMLMTSVKNNDQFYHNYFSLAFPFQWGNFQEAWAGVARYLANSITVTLATVLCVLAVASLTGYAFARYEFSGSGILFMSIMIILMVPGVLTLLPVFVTLRNLNLLDSRLALVVVYVSQGQILATFIFRNFFATIPDDLMDAAEIDGAGELQGIYHMVLPLSKPIVFTVAIMNTLYAWNDYIWPLITLSSQNKWTITLGLVTFQERYAGMSAWGPLFAGYVIASIPLIILFSFSMKYFIAGLTSGAVKG